MRVFTPILIAAAIAGAVVSIAAQEQEGFRFKSGVDLVNVTATVTGEDGRFVPGLRREDFTVYEDGRQLRDFVYVGDVVRANLLVLEDPRADFQAFNVGAGRAVTVVEFAQIVAARAGTGAAPLVTGEYRFGDTRHIVSDISKLRALGWEPQGTFAGNADEYLAWAQRQPDFRNYADEARAYMKKVGAVRSE